MERFPQALEGGEPLGSQEFAVSAEDCAGHFEDGPKIMPAFRLLQRHFVDAMSYSAEENTGDIYLPRKVVMEVGDILPEGSTVTEKIHPHVPDIDSPHGTTLTTEYQRQGTITIQSQVLPHTIKDIGVIPMADRDQAETFRIQDQDTLLGREEINQRIPWGKEIQFLHRVIKPGLDDGILAEGAQKIYGSGESPADYSYTQIAPKNEPLTSMNRGWILDMPQVLDGFGQLVYHYYTEKYGHDRPHPVIPFFKRIAATFNYDYTPKMGEPIYYQLRKLDFTNESQTAAQISGQVVANDKQTVLAEFSIDAGIMAKKMLDMAVSKALKSESK